MKDKVRKCLRFGFLSFMLFLSFKNNVFSGFIKKKLTKENFFYRKFLLIQKNKKILRFVVL